MCCNLTRVFWRLRFCEYKVKLFFLFSESVNILVAHCFAGLHPAEVWDSFYIQGGVGFLKKNKTVIWKSLVQPDEAIACITTFSKNNAE